MIAELGRLARAIEGAGVQLARAPRRWTLRAWAVAAGVAALTTGAYAAKWPLQRLVEGRGGGSAGALARFASDVGGGPQITALLVVVFLVGVGTRRPALVDLAIAAGAAGLWCYALTTVGQIVLAEARPRDGGVLRLLALGGHGVSGHAAAAALLHGPCTRALARRRPAALGRAASALLLVWAGVVAWSRVWLGMHFVWNVVLGLALGFFTGSLPVVVAEPEHDEAQ